jgi:hypothetical protein
MATQTEILRIEVDNKQAIENINEQNKAINMLQKENKELAAQGQKNSLRYQQNAAQIQKLNAARKQNIKLISAEKGSLNELRANLARLTTERNNVNATTQEGAEKFARLNREILKQNEAIKRAEERGGDFRRSVGNYSRTLDGAKNAFGGLTGGIEGASGATSLFNTALLSSPIGIIIVALTSLVAAFTQTEEGALKLKIVIEVVKSVFNDLVGLLAVGGKEIVNFFENPLDNLKKFGESLQNFVVRRVELILDSLGTLGEAFKLLFEGEFSEAADKAGEGFVKLAKNTNPLFVAYDELKEPLGELVEETKDYTTQLVDNAKATANNVIAQKNLEKQSIRLEKQIVKLQKEEERLQKLAEDSTLPFQEQAKAQEELIKVQEERFRQQLNLANQEKKIAQTNLDIRKKQGLDTIELEKQFAEAEKKVFEIQGDQRISNTENLQITRQRDQDIWEQELDFLIDVGEREREVFKRQAEDTELSTEQRSKALENYQESLNLFQQGIRTQFDELGLSDEEINRLLGIKDPKELAEAVTQIDNLSEIEKNRLREGLIELKTTEFEREDTIRRSEKIITDIIDKEEKKRADLRKQRLKEGLSLTQSAVGLASEIIGKETKAGKVLAIAAAGINTAQAVTRTLAQYGGTPIGYAQAATVGALGLKQIADIKNTDVSGGSTGGGGSNTVSTPSIATNTPQVDTSNVDNEVNQQEALLAALESQRFQVSVTEINDAPNAVSVSESDLTL